RDRSSSDILATVTERAHQVYDDKESQYPVLTGMYRFSSQSGGHSRLDRQRLLDWASQRFETEIDPEPFKSKQRDEIHQLLLPLSENHKQIASGKIKAVRDKIQSLYEGNFDTQTIGA